MISRWYRRDNNGIVRSFRILYASGEQRGAVPVPLECERDPRALLALEVRSCLGYMYSYMSAQADPEMGPDGLAKTCHNRYGL